MTLPVLVLQIISTGETLLTESTDQTALIWQKKHERNLLKDKRRTEQVKQAIQAGDTIVGWTNYDEMVKLGEYPDYLFNGYDKWFEQRLDKLKTV